MRTLAVQFLEEGLHRVLFDAMPMPVFVVNKDVSILECNRAATKLIGLSKRQIVRRCCGEVMHCVHAAETPGGCGRSAACLDCVVRNSVKAAFRGKSVSRQRSHMEFATGRKTTRVDLRVTCQPITYRNHPFALVVMEGMGD